MSHSIKEDGKTNMDNIVYKCTKCRKIATNPEKLEHTKCIVYEGDPPEAHD